MLVVAQRRFSRFPLIATATIALAISILMSASQTCAQALNGGLNDSNMLPVPGKGNSYIGLLNETVNPQNGSVSLHISLPQPGGRGINLPFDIVYNSNSTYSVTDVISSNPNPRIAAGVDAQLDSTWGPQVKPPAETPFSRGAWKYSVPDLSFLYQGITLDASYAFPVNSTMVTGYTFYDPMGAPHPMQLYGQLVTSTYTASMAGGDPDYHAVMLGTNPVNSLGVGDPVVISDNDGLSYVFYNGSAITVSDAGVNFVAPGISPITSYVRTDTPSQITDRHGNSFSITNANGPLQYIDTQGRTALSMATVSSSTSTTKTDSISVYGVDKPYIITTTALAPGGYSFNLAFTVTDRALIPSQGGVCVDHTADSGGTGTVPAEPQLDEITQIALPNGDQYNFQYDPAYGTLTKITYPNGGYIKYVWGITPDIETGEFFSAEEQGGTTSDPIWTDAICTYTYGRVSLQSRTVSYDGTTIAQQQNYTYASATSTTVNTYDLISGASFSTVYTYTDFPQSANGQYQAPQCGWPNCPSMNSENLSGVPVESSVLTESAGSLLQSVNKTWYNQYQLESQSVQSGPSGPTSTTSYKYAPSYSFTSPVPLNVGNNVLGAVSPLIAEKDEYDYGATSPTRTTLISYQTSIYGPSLSYTGSGVSYSWAAPIVDRISSSKITSGSITMAETDYSNFNSVGSAQTVTAKCFQSACPGNSITQYAYNSSGQIISMTDPKGNTTGYLYTDAPTDSSSAGGTNAYLTTITYPDGTTNGFKYDYSIGYLTEVDDANKQATKYCYRVGGCSGSSYDPFFRPTEVDYPDGGKTTYTYVDGVYASGAGPSVMTTELLCTSASSSICPSASLSKTSYAYADGIGHVVKTQLVDPYGIDTVNTRYDGEGNVYTVTNPYRSTSDATYGTTTNTYDALGRKTTQIDSDNSSTQTWSYSGNTVLYTDEDQNQWQRTYDSFGRLTQVVEPNGTSHAPSVITNYAYDALSNLSCVAQNTTSSTTCTAAQAALRPRQFTYDSLSHLLTAANPETGSVSYAYDANGNVITKTDARGVTATYQYDSMNRLLNKSYSGNISSVSSSCYLYSSSSATNGIGRLTNEWTQSASVGSCASTAPTTGFITKRSLAYDPMGRIQSEQQYTPASSVSGYASAYTYDFAGNLLTSTNGVGPTLTVIPQFSYSYDASGRLQTLNSNIANNWISGTALSTTIFSSQIANSSCTSLTSQYSPFGGLMNASYGGVITLNKAYDNRLRTMCENYAGTGNTSATSGSATVTITGAEQSK